MKDFRCGVIEKKLAGIVTTGFGKMQENRRPFNQPLSDTVVGVIIGVCNVSR